MRTFYLLASGLLCSLAAHAQLSLRAGVNWAGQTPKWLDHYAGGNSLATTSQVSYQFGLTYRFPLGQQ